VTDIPAIVTDLLRAGVVTLEIAFGAWLVGAIVGLGFAALRELNVPLPVAPSIAALRSVPDLVLLYLVFFGLGQVGIRLGAVPSAILALGIAEAAFVSEYFRAAFMTVPPSQREAGLSLGLRRIAVLRLIVVPQIVPFMIPPLANMLIGLLKLATLASAIGAPEILSRGTAIMATEGHVVEITLLVAGIYIAATLPASRMLARWESRLRLGA
jgi:polar amino acid transport system permease protein